MHNSVIPKWVRLVAILTVMAQAAAFAAFFSGRLQGSARNVLFQVIIGGLGVLVLLAGYLWRYHATAVPPAPSRLGIVLLIILAVGLSALYVYRVRPLLRMPYDLASWSEPMMIVDIIKLRTGESLYLPPDDSNSTVYTPGAPAVTYFLAWLFGRPTSIPFYRLLQQFYLVLAMIFAAGSARDLVRLAAPERFRRVPWLWLIFFALASFLLATNSPTTAFNVFLHNDAFALLASTVAFWLLTRHAVTRDSRWLWAMAVAPALCFMVKQIAAVWAVAYAVHLWLDGGYSFRRVLVFTLACFGTVAAALGVCLLVWGEPFRYWAFEPMGSQVVSPLWITRRYADAAPCILLGLLGGGVLLGDQNVRRFFGVWASWFVMLLAGLYTSGMTYHPTHLGAATMVGGCFALAALAFAWRDSSAPAESPPLQWHRLGLSFLLVFTLFADLGFTRDQTWQVSPDLSRYVREIEREFDGLAPERVLLDMGDWIYLRHNLVMKDRATILLTHQTPHFGLIERIHRQEYAKILVHFSSNGTDWYDIDRDRGIKKALLTSYREVRRIPRVQGVENWLYRDMLMGDVSVFEPIPRTSTDATPPPGNRQH